MGSNGSTFLRGYRSSPSPSLKAQGDPQGDPDSVTWLPPVTPDRPKTGNGFWTSPGSENRQRFLDLARLPESPHPCCCQSFELEGLTCCRQSFEFEGLTHCCQPFDFKGLIQPFEFEGPIFDPSLPVLRIRRPDLLLPVLRIGRPDIGLSNSTFFPLQSRRVCTVQPACQLENSRSTRVRQR